MSPEVAIVQRQSLPESLQLSWPSNGSEATRKKLDLAYLGQGPAAAQENSSVVCKRTTGSAEGNGLAIICGRESRPESVETSFVKTLQTLFLTLTET